MLSNVDNNIFLNSSSLEMFPVVSAEWNNNLFNPPYITVAGTGVPENISYAGSDLSDESASINAKAGTTTSSFTFDGTQKTLTYTIHPANPSAAYKIITYIQTDSASPIMVNAYANGSSSTQFGSANQDVNSFGYTPVITYIGSSGPGDNISSMTYTVTFNAYNNDSLKTDGPMTVYITTPEVYQTTYFDYQNSTLWPTTSPFSGFRPGESYIGSGNTNASFPTDFRKINTPILNGSSASVFPPITPIMQNPSFGVVSPPASLYKNALAHDLAPYKYFVSDAGDGSNQSGNKYTNSFYSPSISAIYEPGINANKIVLKFNTIMMYPTISVYLDDQSIWSGDVNSADGSITLYYNNGTWSTTKWSTMPKFLANGSVSKFTNFKKITVTQSAVNIRDAFSSYLAKSSAISDDFKRMQLIEASPRLEIDLSDYVMELDVTKQLDSKNNYIPISSINPNDASLTLSAIPLTVSNSPVPLFSSQNNMNVSLLSGMLRKNIKFYFGWDLKNYTINSGTVQSNTYIPAGVYYSNAWDETDIQTVKISCYDIVNYLQTHPVPDFVSNLKSVFDTITNLLDLAGFTDYDYDSLYNVCHDNSRPMDMYYFYCNSQDSTLYDALSEIFLSYQIGAYIDEYGVMKFLSLSDILSNSSSSVASFTDASILQGGYSIVNKAKPGKISIRYQEPKVIQSLALQNATDPTQQNSPSFIYTTSNDILWEQKQSDSVGFNYLAKEMKVNDNSFSLNVNDLLDIFHTYSLNSKGYAVIENEIVSFAYKEYKISDTSGNSQTVAVKNDLELSSAINAFVKRFETGLQVSTLDINGHPVKATSYNVTVEATGSINNVQRGLFGTVPADHASIVTSANISTKGLSESTVDSLYGTVNSTTNCSAVSSSYSNNDVNLSNPNLQKIAVNIPATKKVLIYPTSTYDQGFQTYSAKFDFSNSANVVTSGLFFNAPSGMSSQNGTYFVEFVRYNNYNPKLTTENFSTDVITYVFNNPPTYKYFISIYQIVSGTPTLIAYADATGAASNIVQNFEKILVKQQPASGSTAYSYAVASDACFDLKTVWYTSNGEDGETPGTLIEVFLNNFEITGWNLANGKPTDKNTVTGTRKKVNLPSAPSQSTHFGYFTSTSPYLFTGVSVPTPQQSAQVASNFRELYATQKPLKERSVSYFWQDREFLNGIIQGQNLFSKYHHYIVQTNPDVKGINYYDVQYDTPGATVADIDPVYYTWFYFPGTNSTDQQYYQQQLVDEYSVAYSTVINTGFRGRFAVANNSSHMVYLKHDSDTLNSFTTALKLWTHEVIAPSDAQLLEKVLDPANTSEVVQVDSTWIQSKESADKLASVIAFGNDGFSKDTTIQIFGNPLIEVGDIINLTYGLAGLKNQKYLVHQVAHVFQKGLKTTLTLNMLGKGTQY